jgi:hypothetical protein
MAKVEDAEAIAHMYEQHGKLQEAQELRQKIEQAKASTRALPPRVDFFNPTAEMIEDGKKNGFVQTTLPNLSSSCTDRIDLSDKRVQQMLASLQDEHLTKGTVPKPFAASGNVTLLCID